MFNEYIQFIVVIAGIGTLIHSLENIRCISIVSEKGILSWDILQHQNPTKNYQLFNILFEPRGLMAVYISQSLLAIASLILAALHIYPTYIFASLLILYAIPALRSSFGIDGAIQMYIIVYFSLVIITVPLPNTVVPELGVIFLGVQAALSYSISGIAKLTSPAWRNGSALRGIFSTQIYGNELIFRFFNSYPRLCCMSSWFVILFECLFVISVLISPTTALVFLGIGVCFHIFNMVFMGLNNFFFAFLATYPAIYYMATYFDFTILPI